MSYRIHERKFGHKGLRFWDLLLGGGEVAQNGLLFMDFLENASMAVIFADGTTRLCKIGW